MKTPLQNQIPCASHPHGAWGYKSPAGRCLAAAAAAQRWFVKPCRCFARCLPGTEQGCAGSHTCWLGSPWHVAEGLCSHVHPFLKGCSRSAPGPVASGLPYAVNSRLIVSDSSHSYGRSKKPESQTHDAQKSNLVIRFWTSDSDQCLVVSLWCTTAAVATVGGDHGLIKCPEINMMWLVSALEGRRRKNKHYCNSVPQSSQLWGKTVFLASSEGKMKQYKCHSQKKEDMESPSQKPSHSN